MFGVLKYAISQNASAFSGMAVFDEEEVQPIFADMSVIIRRCFFLVQKSVRLLFLFAESVVLSLQKGSIF